MGGADSCTANNQVNGARIPQRFPLPRKTKTDLEVSKGPGLGLQKMGYGQGVPLTQQLLFRRDVNACTVFLDLPLVSSCTNTSMPASNSPQEVKSNLEAALRPPVGNEPVPDLPLPLGASIYPVPLEEGKGGLLRTTDCSHCVKMLPGSMDHSLFLAINC